MASRKKLSFEQFKNGTKIVFKYFFEHREKVIWIGILSVISAIASAATPYLLGKLFDALTIDATPYTIFSYTLSPFVAILSIWLAVRIISDIAERYRTLGSQELDELISMSYILRGVIKLLHLPLSFHKRHKIGTTMSRIERAGGRLGTIISQVIILIGPDILSVFIALVLVFFIDSTLALVLLGGVASYIVVVGWSTPRYQGLLDTMHRAYQKTWGSAYDAVMNAHAVKQATAEAYEKRKSTRNFIARSVGAWVEYSRVFANLTLVQRLIVTFTQFILFMISVYFIRSGRITLGDLVAFNGYAAMMFAPFYRLGSNWDRIQTGLISLQHAEQTLNLPDEIYVPKNVLVLSNLKGEVEFVNVSFKYGRRQSEVLRDISFQAKPGETIALVGESGVGKSTLIDLISYYYKPTGGKILIDGHDAARLDLTSLRTFIAVVAQEPILFNDTVKNNIKYGSFWASDEKVTEAARMAHATEFIEKFSKKYGQVVGERGIRLSAGQKQRIAIARAILRDPRILILDEPTSALDAKSEKFITESLEKLMEGRTTFIIAHRLSTVRKADKILVLEGGKIVEEGKHEELVKMPHGIYRRLYELQVGLK